MEKNVFLNLILLAVILLNVITSMFNYDIYTVGGWVVAFLVASRQLLLQFDVNRINHIAREHDKFHELDDEKRKYEKNQN